MSRLLRAALVAITGAAAVAIVSRIQLLTGFGQLWGSEFDGGIEAAILEHWFNALRGLEPWNRPGWFFPHADTLGYNDGYLLFGLLHAAFRTAGADVFVTSALVDMAVRAVGFAAMFACLRRVLACRFAFALWGAGVFTLAAGLFTHSIHQQLLSVAFAPVLALLVWRAWQALAAGCRLAYAGWAAAAAMFWGAWLLTAYYMAWFAALFALVLAVTAALLAGRARVAATLLTVRRASLALVAIILVAAAAVVPFLAVYLPKLRETGGQGWSEVRWFLPRVNDLVNTGPGNLMWGRLQPLLCPLCTRNGFELTTGVTPLLFLAAAAATVWLLRTRRRSLPAALALATASCAALAIHWGGLSPWWLVWKLVPGAGGVRVVSRIFLFLLAPAIAVVTVYAQHLADGHFAPGRSTEARLATRVPRPVLLLLGLLVLLEQGTASYPMYTRRAELAHQDVPPPPPACRSFYVSAVPESTAGSGVFALYPHNVVAMLLAERLALPTINGFSTFNPPDWDFADPLRPDYETRVRAYAHAHAIEPGLCRLDLLTRRWLPPQPPGPT